jgi:hypothetical protein
MFPIRLVNLADAPSELVFNDRSGFFVRIDGSKGLYNMYILSMLPCFETL